MTSVLISNFENVWGNNEVGTQWKGIPASPPNASFSKDLSPIFDEVSSPSSTDDSEATNYCGQLNHLGEPCKRRGKCPFHGAHSKKFLPKKGWTEKEHALFLQGLKLHGRGSWRKISKFVGTKTPSQVQSHGQKYFLRQNQTDKRKRSINDLSAEEKLLLQETPCEKKFKPAHASALNEGRPESYSEARIEEPFQAFRRLPATQPIKMEAHFTSDLLPGDLTVVENDFEFKQYPSVDDSPLSSDQEWPAELPFSLVEFAAVKDWIDCSSF